jgi:hypothetical protein
MAADLLVRVCAEIDARLAELRPAVAEHERLLGAADALDADEAKARALDKVRPAAKARPAGQARAARKARPAGNARPAGKEPAAKARKVRPAGKEPAAKARKARPAGKAQPAGKEPAAKARSARKARPAGNARTTANGRAGAKGAAGGGEQAPMGAAEQAIVAALEHGSHTVGELGIVTAMGGPEIRESLRRLQREGTVAPTRREGRAAYALSSAAAG